LPIDSALTVTDAPATSSACVGDVLSPVNGIA
jgi:hypothetical protein